MLDDTPQSVKIKANETMTFEFRNQPKTQLLIVKKDRVTGEEIVPSASGTRVPSEAVILNSTPFKASPVTASFLELKAAKGYLADSTPQKIEVKDGETATLEMTNKKASFGSVICPFSSVTYRPFEEIVPSASGTRVPSEAAMTVSLALPMAYL